jgi:hypothetical protein
MNVGKALTKKNAIDDPHNPPPIPQAAIKGNFFLASPVGKTSFANVQNVRNRIVLDKYENGYSMTRIHEIFSTRIRSEIKRMIKITNSDDAQIKSSFDNNLPLSRSSIFLKKSIGNVNRSIPFTRYSFEIIVGPNVETTRESETFSPTMAPQKMNASKIVV